MSMSREWFIRPATRADLPLLRRMLWAAAFWQEPSEANYAEGDLERHGLAFLLEEWGRPGDTGVIAESEAGEPLGVAWYRFWTEERHFYGYVSPEIPELGIAVTGHARGRGIGTRLMDELLRVAERSGQSAVSLSVVPENPALRLYERFGFRKVGQSGDAWVMVKTF